MDPRPLSPVSTLLGLLALLALCAGCGGGGGGGGPAGGPHEVAFQAPTSIDLSLLPTETLVLDANRDGIADVAVIGTGPTPGAPSRLEVRLGRRGGGLDPTPVFSTNLVSNAIPVSMVPHGSVADSDGDGDDDILVTFEPSATESIDVVCSYLSRGDGQFDFGTHFRVPGMFFHGPVVFAQVVTSDANSMDDIAVVHAPTAAGVWRLGQYVR